jgi:hypothetical protein
MSAEPVVPIALSWLLTYLVHSTLLLLAVALVTRCLPRAAMGAREALWKLALVGGLGTASIQLACSTDPWFGRLPVAPPASVERSAALQTTADDASLPPGAATGATDECALESPAPSEFGLVDAAQSAARRAHGSAAARERGGTRALPERALLDHTWPEGALAALDAEPTAARESELDAGALYMAGVLAGMPRCSRRC